VVGRGEDVEHSAVGERPQRDIAIVPCGQHLSSPGRISAVRAMSLRADIAQRAPRRKIPKLIHAVGEGKEFSSFVLASLLRDGASACCLAGFGWGGCN
jgi:hypothetical protein